MNKKSIILPMMLIVALSAVGVAQALWFETLTFEGTVATGTVDVDWFCPVAPFDNEAAGKDVSNIEINTVLTGFMGKISGDTLSVTINNAYPSITYQVEFWIVNMGTVPVHIQLNGPTGDAVEGLSLVFYKVGPGPITPLGPLIAIEDVQLHTGGYGIWGVLTFHMTNQMSYEQGQTYNFAFELVAHQYNEAP